MVTKLVHNIRIRVTDHDRDTVKRILDTLLRDAHIERKDIELLVTSDQDPQDPLYVGELWMDHQPPVRKVIKLLQEKLTAADKAALAEKPLFHLDTGTHCFIKIDKQQFLDGTYEFATTGSVVHIRLNIAAFPATKENAAKIAAQLFTEHS
jgi:RNA binding exosome subunit